MAGNSVIGALRVSLGLDSAQFEQGLKKAQANLGGFGKVASTAFKAVSVAAIAAGAALGVATKHAIDHADELSKTAQKIGVATEALSRLEWAAKLSDVSLEQLSGGLGRLSRSMLDVANGSKGPAATAFAALGISVTDASGKLRAADDVFADVADRFSRMEDGTTKTSLAMAVFGRTGAELIPLLNSGRDGLKAMADESDRLGNTISTTTGKAAEEFNDSLTRVGAVLQGVTNKIMEAALPALNRFGETLTSPEFTKAAQDFGTTIVTALDWIAQRAVEVIDLIRGIGGALEWANSHDMFGNPIKPNELAIAKGRFNAEQALTSALNAGNMSAPDAGFFSGIFPGAAGAPPMPDVKPFTADLGALKSASDTAKQSLDPLQARIAELSDVLTLTKDPIEQMKLDLVDLKTIWDEGRIGVEQYQQAVQRTMLNTASAAFGMASQVTGALTEIFEGNKGFAVANAIVNTLEGATKALAQGGLFGFIGAGAVLASGAAQVASILSTTPNSTSVPNTGTSTPAVAQPTQQAAGTSIFVELKGSRFSRDDVEEFLKELNAGLADGMKLYGV